MFPFILRSHHEEVVSLLRESLSEGEARILELEHEARHRIPRVLHEEAMKVLRDRIVELERTLGVSETARTTLTDTMTGYIFGKVIKGNESVEFHQQTRREAENEIPINRTADQEASTDLAEAKKATGSRNPRVLAEWIENKNRVKWNEAQKRARTVPSDFEDAIREGQQAAKKSAESVEATA